MLSSVDIFLSNAVILYHLKNHTSSKQVPRVVVPVFLYTSIQILSSKLSDSTTVLYCSRVSGSLSTVELILSLILHVLEIDEG
jgi:hypothetical protein